MVTNHYDCNILIVFDIKGRSINNVKLILALCLLVVIKSTPPSQARSRKHTKISFILMGKYYLANSTQSAKYYYKPKCSSCGKWATTTAWKQWEISAMQVCENKG